VVVLALHTAFGCSMGVRTDSDLVSVSRHSMRMKAGLGPKLVPCMLSPLWCASSWLVVCCISLYTCRLVKTYLLNEVQLKGSRLYIRYS
jgi:hypothetical protein